MGAKVDPRVAHAPLPVDNGASVSNVGGPVCPVAGGPEGRGKHPERGGMSNPRFPVRPGNPTTGGSGDATASPECVGVPSAGNTRPTVGGFQPVHAGAGVQAGNPGFMGEKQLGAGCEGWGCCGCALALPAQCHVRKGRTWYPALRFGLKVRAEPVRGIEPGRCPGNGPVDAKPRTTTRTEPSFTGCGRNQKQSAQCPNASVRFFAAIPFPTRKWI